MVIEGLNLVRELREEIQCNSIMLLAESMMVTVKEVNLTQQKHQYNLPVIIILILLKVRIISDRGQFFQCNVAGRSRGRYYQERDTHVSQLASWRRLKCLTSIGHFMLE